MKKLDLYGKITVKDGAWDSLADILLEAAESMKDLDGCEIYLVSTSDDEPNAVIV